MEPVLAEDTQLVTLTAALTRPARLWSGEEVLARPSPTPPTSGVYGCWFDVAPPGVDVSRCLNLNGRWLLYVGKSQNLQKRMYFHFSANAEGSTLRKTLGCLLADELGIRLQRVGRSVHFAGGEEQLNQWMRRHVSVAWLEASMPGSLEEHLIGTLELPLNLEGNERNVFHPTLRRIRSAAMAKAHRH